MPLASSLPMAAIAAATQRRGLFGAPMAADAQQPPMSGDYPYAMRSGPTYTPPSVGRRIVGGIGDAVQQWAGGHATFAPEMEQRRQEALLQQAEQLKRAQDYADWQAKEQYKAAHPDPTSFQQDLQAAGIDPNSDQGRKLYQQRVQNLADPIQAIPGVDAQGNHVLYQMRSSQMGGGQAQSGPPQAAIDYLTKNPNTAAMFDQKYGQGASQRYLQGGAPSQGGAMFP